MAILPGSKRVLWTFPFFLISVYSAALNKNSTGQEPSCKFTADISELWKKAFLACKEDLNLKDIPEWNAPLQEIVNYYNQVAENGYEDKCLTKCVLDKLKILTSEGNVDAKVLEKLFMGGNMTEPFRQGLIAQWKMCNTIIEQEFPGSGNDAKLCKKAARLDYCLLEKGLDIDPALVC